MCGGQRPAAEGEEVLVDAGDVGTEGRRPELGDPCLGAVEFGLGGRGLGQRPRQGRAVHFAGGPGRQFFDQGQARHHARGQVLAQEPGRARQVEVAGALGDEVGHEHRLAGVGLLHRGGAGAHPGQRGHGGVDLTQLEATAADLDLVVDPAVEVQPVGLEPDHVAGAVGAVPAQGVRGPVLLGVLLGVEVARQADTTDDQFAGLPVAHRLAGGVDHREVPAVEW